MIHHHQCAVKGKDPRHSLFTKCMTSGIGKFRPQLFARQPADSNHRSQPKVQGQLTSKVQRRPVDNDTCSACRLFIYVTFLKSLLITSAT